MKRTESLETLTLWAKTLRPGSVDAPFTYHHDCAMDAQRHGLNAVRAMRAIRPGEPLHDAIFETVRRTATFQARDAFRSALAAVGLGRNL